MKKIILLVLMFIGASVFSQTTVDLSGMTGDITLGSNCSASQPMQQFQTTSDTNFNGHTVHLRNAFLKVNGYINGPGGFDVCGQSVVCTTMNVQNNPTIPSGVLVDCNVLGLTEFPSINEIPRGLSYTVYDMTGKRLYSGNTSTIDLPRGEYFILEVQGYKAQKLFIIK